MIRAPLKFCDLRCAHAQVPRAEMDGSRSCMTFNAIYCALHHRHVQKAQPCPDRVEKPRETASGNKED